MSKGIQLYSYIEQQLKALAIKTLAQGSTHKYVAVTGVFTSLYGDDATVYLQVGDGKGKLTEQVVKIPLPMLEEWGFEKYKAIEAYNDFYTQKNGYEGCFSTGGTVLGSLKELVQQGGFAFGLEGWSLKNLLSVPVAQDHSMNLRIVATQLKNLIATSTLDGSHTFRMDAVPSRALPKFFVQEDWTQDAPATFNHVEFGSAEAHMTLCVFSKESNALIGTIEVPYTLVHEMSTDFKKNYMSHELQAYGAFMAQWLATYCKDVTFTSQAGGTIRFEAAQPTEEYPKQHVLVRLTQPNTPTTVKRQERFIEMTKLLAEQGVRPKTSIKGQPVFQMELGNGQILLVGATFGVLYKNEVMVGVLYNLEQTSIEQVIASVTLTNNPLLIWFVTSMDLRTGIKPCPIRRNGGRA